MLKILLLLGVASIGWGVEISLAPEEVGLDETATLVVVHTEAIEDIVLPTVEGLSFRYHGMAQSSSLQIINGQTTITRQYQYKYAVIPSRQGRFVIPSFDIRDRRQRTFRTDPLVLRVEGRRAQRVPSPQATGGFVLPRIFYILEPERTFALQNEAVILTGYIVSDQREALFYPVQQIRPFMVDNAVFYEGSGFLDAQVFRRGGFWYRALHQWVLFAVEPGALAVAPPQLIAVSPVGQITVPTENIVLDIRRSEVFRYRGRLKATAELRPAVITQGMTLEYVVTLQGDGNLQVFSDVLHGATLSNVSVSPVQTVHRVTNWQQRPEFFQRLTYQLKPSKIGEGEIPSVSLLYQDERGKERTLVLPAKRFEVIEVLDEQRQFSPMAIRGERLVGYAGASLVFWLVLVVVIGFPVGFYFWQRHAYRMETDEGYARYMRSLTKMDEYFYEAKHLLGTSGAKEFAQVLYKALLYYVLDRERFSRDLTKVQAVSALAEKGWGKEERDALLHVLGALETMAYAPSTSSSQMREIYEKAELLLKKRYHVLCLSSQHSPAPICKAKK